MARNIVSTRPWGKVRLRLEGEAGFAFADRAKLERRNELAEGEGFEPSIPFGIPAFQASALGHYATLPGLENQLTIPILIVNGLARIYIHKVMLDSRKWMCHDVRLNKYS